MPVGASHVNVTVPPLTNDVKPEGGDGAFAAAWTRPATVREQRLLSEAKIPALLAVKQLQVVTTLPATPTPVIVDAAEPATIGSAIVGALGVAALQLQSVMASAIAAPVRARSATEIGIRNLCLSL